MVKRFAIFIGTLISLLIPATVFADIAALPPELEENTFGKILIIGLVIVIALTIIITVGMYINKRKK